MDGQIFCNVNKFTLSTISDRLHVKVDDYWEFLWTLCKKHLFEIINFLHCNFMTHINRNYVKVKPITFYLVFTFLNKGNKSDHSCVSK